MNYIINNKTIILMAFSSLIMNGCVTKTAYANRTTSMNKITPIYPIVQRPKQNKWKKFSSIKKVTSSQKKDCIDCFAAPIKSTKIARAVQNNNYNMKSNEVISFDYSKPPSQSFANNPMPKKDVVAIDTYSYDAYDYTVTPDDTYIKPDVSVPKKVTKQISYVNSSHGSYSSKTAVQIGAFRRYAGAKIYAKKYDLLSSTYHVAIETGVKDKKPIHRVRIEGFSTRSEAKNFITRYGINDAFLVRR